MYENAYRIRDFLPKDSGSENLYIIHLWKSFEALSRYSEVAEEKDKLENESSKPFALVPFHLLFMFSLQFKILRIRESMFLEYHDFAKICQIYSKNDRAELVKSLKKLTSGSESINLLSVRYLSKIREKEIPKFFKILSCDKDTIAKITWLIENRNDLAHANGNIEEQIEQKIDEYLSLLEYLQGLFLPMNDGLAIKWAKELDESEDKQEFLQTKTIQNYLCQADFESGLLKDF